MENKFSPLLAFYERSAVVASGDRRPRPSEFTFKADITL